MNPLGNPFGTTPLFKVPEIANQIDRNQRFLEAPFSKKPTGGFPRYRPWAVI